MIFTAASGYALQSLAHMPEDGSFMMAKDLSAQLKLPAPYLAKILQRLARSGILESVRGPKGGFRLSRPSHHITVGEVLIAMEGPGTLDACIMGFPSCDGDNPCPMHEAWSAVKALVESSMTSNTLRDLQLTKMRRTHLQSPQALHRGRG
ncbi:MAG: Rrf2 family transcriptional regulator [Holophagaceae bacterium]|nr:Rrf2 family transcriptional regulator [Holophagaceae bacterium]